MIIFWNWNEKSLSKISEWRCWLQQLHSKEGKKRATQHVGGKSDEEASESESNVDATERKMKYEENGPLIPFCLLWVAKMDAVPDW